MESQYGVILQNGHKTVFDTRQVFSIGFRHFLCKTLQISPEKYQEPIVLSDIHTYENFEKLQKLHKMVKLPDKIETFQHFLGHFSTWAHSFK